MSLMPPLKYYKSQKYIKLYFNSNKQLCCIMLCINGLPFCTMRVLGFRFFIFFLNKQGMLKTQFLVLENTDAPTQLTLVDFRHKPSLLRPITALP